MENNYYNNLISKLLSGEITALEEKELYAWLQKDSSNLDELKTKERVWKLAEGKEKKFEPAVEPAWQKFSRRLENQRVLRRNKTWFAIAAAFLLLAAVVFTFKDFETKANIIRTTSAQADVFYLPDSSIVWLDKASELIYPEEFSTEKRVVRLKGHAYFKVKKNDAAPFFVLAGETETRVVGTAFDVIAYNNLSYIEIVVSEGKVLFSSQIDKVILEKNEKGVFEKESKMISKVSTLKEGSITWIEDKEEFTGTEEYKKENRNPVSYLRNSISWKRNLINQTVIDGYITNAAIFTSYHDVVLKVTHYNSKGKKLGENLYTIQDTIKPGYSAEYKYRLPDWFENTREVYVEIEKAVPLKEVERGSDSVKEEEPETENNTSSTTS